MSLKIERIIYNFYKKIKKHFFSASHYQTARGLIIEFEYYDSDFKNISAEVYDFSSTKFVKCSFVPSRRTFKWRRHEIFIDLKSPAVFFGADFILKITKPAISGLHPFVVSSISLKACGEAENGSHTEILSRFDASSAGFIKSGFCGPYVNSYKKVFTLSGSLQNSPAYIIFSDVAEKALAAGFKFAPGIFDGGLKIIDTFMGADNDRIKITQPQNIFNDDGSVEKNSAGELKAATEEMIAQEAPEEIIAQEAPEEIIAREAPEEIIAQEAPAAENYDNEKSGEKCAAEFLDASQPYKSYFLINFFSKKDWAPSIRRLNPGFVKRVITKADGILNGEYEINGYYFKLSAPIDWHSNFNYSKWPATESYKYFSSLFIQSAAGLPSNEEGIWPLSVQFAKNNEWVYLALAYKFSGEEKYVIKIADLFKEFKAQNEIGFGINYACSSACAERLVSWLMAFELIEEKFAALFASLGFHDYFNKQFDHLYERVVGRPRESDRHERAAALACLYGVLLQVGGRTTFAPGKVYKKLKEEILSQTLADGSHISSSPVFLFSVYKSMLYSLVISKKSAAAGPSPSPDCAFKDAAFIGAFERIGEHLVSMAAPNGLLPNLSDYYGVFFLPFDERSPFDLRPSLQAASCLLMDKNLKFLTAENKISEIVMLFGEEGAAEYSAMPVSVAENFSSKFESSGYFCVTAARDPFGDNNGAARLIFNYGGGIQRAANYNNFEFLQHNDLHNIIISHGSVDFISDSGPALFIKNKEIYFYKKNLSAHNSVVLNKTNFNCGKTEAFMPDSFRSYEHGGACLISSTHKGYHSVDIDALIRRTIVMINGDYLLIMDDVFNSRKKPVYFDVDIFFHSPPDITIESVSPPGNKNLTIFNSRSSEAKMINLNHCAQKISASIYRASCNPAAGWHSSLAGHTNESSTIIQSVRFAKLPVRIYNLFYLVKADDNINSIAKKLRMNLNKINSSIEICHRDFKDSIKINEKFEVDFSRMAVKV